MNETLIDTLKAYTAALEQKIAALEQRVAECTTQNTQCTEAHAKLEERLATLEERIAQQEAHIEQLEAALVAATVVNATVAQVAPETLSATDTTEEEEPEIEVELITDDEVEEEEEPKGQTEDEEEQQEEETTPSTHSESVETTPIENAENTQSETHEAQPIQMLPTNALYGKAVSDIRKGISIGDRFLFQRELFQNNPELLQKTLTELNELHSFDEAMAYIDAHFDWDKDQPAYELFLNALHRRFSN